MGVTHCKDLRKPLQIGGFRGVVAIRVRTCSITYMTTTTLTISTNALSDHMDRLYDIHDSGIEGPTWPHIDGASSGVIIIIKVGSKTTQVQMTANAIAEFIDDMDYQVECCEDDFQRAYRAQCKRALTSIRKQLAK